MRRHFLPLQRWVLVLAMGVFGASIGASWREWRALDQLLRTVPVPAELRPEAVAPLSPRTELVGAASEWVAPENEADGTLKAAGLFAAPELSRDPATGRWRRLAGINSEHEAGAKKPVSGALVDFRLVGYLRGAVGWTGVFGRAGEPRTLLVRAGEELERSGWVFDGLEFATTRHCDAEGRVRVEPTVAAKLREIKTGKVEKLPLTSPARDEPKAAPQVAKKL